MMTLILIFIVGAVLGAVASGVYFLKQRRQEQDRQQFILREQEERSRLLLHAMQQQNDATAKEAELRTKSELMELKANLEREYEEMRKEILAEKRRVDKKEENLERKADQIEQRENDQEQRRIRLDREHQILEETSSRYRELLSQVNRKLEEVAQLTREEAKKQVISQIEEDARREAARIIKQLEEETKDQAQNRAQDVIVTAVQRFAGEFVAEHTVSAVTLPSDDMKGRIIGREGRNIRALEAATGCDLIIDDTPEAVVISGFHPVRRQVAKRVLEELISDGRIHPARIEEVVRKAKKNINNEIREAGEQAVFDMGLHGIHQEIIKLLGTLKFRTSYTQNVLNHSIEVAHFAGIMADELGLDGAMARRCGLLHDIGKAVDHEVQGSHAIIGGQLAKRFKEHPLVVNAISAHHFDIEPISVYAPLTHAADALSAARPGARRETMEIYIKRLEDLERIASDFKGVEKAYAIQAGRELRVIVNFERLNDEGAILLARDIARKVEEEITYPGQIKVTVIREMRATELAH